jgi:hypothetical protein
LSKEELMCGRFTITLAPAEFEEEFDFENIPEYHLKKWG